MNADGKMNQHTSPCKDCPWNRNVQPGELGGSPAETYVGQAVLNFWLPCHSSTNYAAKESDVNKVCQCAGAATFRTNIGVQVPPQLLQLPKDTEKVFSTLAEFYAHHKRISIIEAKLLLTPRAIHALAMRELNSTQVRMQLKQRE